jgi:hypothetical protein
MSRGVSKQVRFLDWLSVAPLPGLPCVGMHAGSTKR